MAHLWRHRDAAMVVSMKSGLEGRNNAVEKSALPDEDDCLNEVRPRRPEQSNVVLPCLLRP